MQEFAGAGLRTLCLATKDIDPAYFADWRRRYHAASTSLVDREDKVTAVYEEIEKNMTLIGATAIEDKLQDGVPDTIASLAVAGIKIWVLTGDKQGMLLIKLSKFNVVYSQCNCVARLFIGF